ncbi:TRAP transporter small permease subunit [Aestuariivita boseongensis]|uniref:TRAP transporter small permease subunit n=1 Tax=Aestuariivita boseongensis TaxID=1470562 RepID=UPI0006833ADA|nr:TRAP transporter small permease subunit [Aestuariivita boseongensis]
MSDTTTPQREPLPLRLLDGITQGLNVAGSTLILLLMTLVGIDVAGRNLAGNPISGVPELVTLSIVAIVFLQIPAALRQGRMTQSDAFIGWLTRTYPTIGNLLATLFDLIAIAVIWVILRETWPIFTRAWDRGEFVGAVGDFAAPVWPVKLILILGGSVLILQFAARIWRRYR